MPKRVIRGELSVKGIQSIIDQLREYKQELNDKTELFCRKLAEAGLVVAQAKVGESTLGKYVSVRLDVSPSKAGCRALLIATGQTKTSEWQAKDGGVKTAEISCLAMVEFGSGVSKNPVVNPKASDFGMGPGTFPKQTHAGDNVWYWMDLNGIWHSSSGIKATMPMYSASVEIREKIISLAKEVFD